MSEIFRLLHDETPGLKHASGDPDIVRVSQPFDPCGALVRGEFVEVGVDFGGLLLTGCADDFLNAFRADFFRIRQNGRCLSGEAGGGVFFGELDIGLAQDG